MRQTVIWKLVMIEIIKHYQADAVYHAIGTCLLTKFSWKIEMKACISNYTHVNQWDDVTHPCPNYNHGLHKSPLKLGDGGVITA